MRETETIIIINVSATFAGTKSERAARAHLFWALVESFGEALANHEITVTHAEVPAAPAAPIAEPKRRGGPRGPRASTIAKRAAEEAAKKAAEWNAAQPRRTADPQQEIEDAVAQNHRTQEEAA